MTSFDPRAAKPPAYMSVARDGQHDLRMNDDKPRSYHWLVIAFLVAGSAAIWTAFLMGAGT